ncbi:DUF3307 domain-containing protein [uncultured Tateyamaria sp.]|uniref:DUF3307 domain-containing protein n=1 Tax=uncultured Tateyamaria sp. TaxID=455651 RepID=UPI002625DF92|nr:DUF3307 domain-containing protein [uncultured Tateyamaria sp.]
MADPITFALVLLFLLQAKHLFADFYLQTPRMLRDRGRYLHLGRLQHAGLHAVGSLIALVLMGVPVGLAIVVALVEWAVHFHIDFGKGRWSDHTGHGPHQAGYWRAFGVDQALHQWTYLVMVWAVLP